MSRHRRLMAGLFVLVWLSCAWFGSWELNANNATRLFATFALVEEGQGVIDRYAPLTIDKAEFGGHFFLDKAPGMTVLSIPAVAAVDALTGDRMAAYGPSQTDAAFSDAMRLRLRVAAALTGGLLTAIAAASLFDLAAGLTGSAAAGLFAALGYALGTPAWGWSTTVLGHAPVAALFVIAAWATWRGTRGAGSVPLATVAGGALGLAVAIEYTAVLAGLAIVGWAVFRIVTETRARAPALLAAGLVGGAIGLSPWVGYDLWVFGTPFRLGYSGVVGWSGMDQGLFGLTYPHPVVLGELLFGQYRGLFWVAPVLLLAAPGLMAAVEDRRTRDVGVMVVAVVAIVLLINAAYVYWDGGNSTGPRHSIPLVGLAALGLAITWCRFGQHGRWVAAAMLVGSIALNSLIAASDIFAGSVFRRPITEDVLQFDFVRDVPGEWWGWSPWAGYALWAAMAVPLAIWLAVTAARADAVRRA